MTEIWVLIGPDGDVWKGSGWSGKPRHAIKAFDNERAAKISAGQWQGVTVKKVALEVHV